MKKWVKISNEYFDVDLMNTQLSIGSHANINLTLNTINNPQAYNFFTSWFDTSLTTTADNYKKNISCKDFDSKGCFIKSIDFDPNSKILIVDICCDYVETANISERRDSKIDDILGQTSGNK
jgi:hypothetical protein